MKASKFDRVEQPKPVEPEWKMCAAPGCAFRAECLVPVGERAVQMCWLCAHHVSEHDCSVELAATGECECIPHEIYPNRPHPSVLNGTYVDPPRYIGRHSERWINRGELTKKALENGATLRFVHGDGVGRGRNVMHLYNRVTGCMDTIVDGETVDSAPLVASVREERSRRKSS